MISALIPVENFLQIVQKRRDFAAESLAVFFIDTVMNIFNNSGHAVLELGEAFILRHLALR